MTAAEVHEAMAASPRAEGVVVDLAEPRPRAAAARRANWGEADSPLGLAAHPSLVLLAAGLTVEEALERAQLARIRYAEMAVTLGAEP